MISAFLLLLAGHYLADFPLQADFIAKMKGKVFRESIGFHCLTAHAAIHGLITWLLIGNTWAAIAMGVSHWLIDFCKSWEGFDDNWPHNKGARMGPQVTGLWGINIDQALHVTAALAIAAGVTLTT